MHHRAKLLAGVCGLLLSSAALQPAVAAAPMGFAGNFGGEYRYLTCDGCGGESLWGINGSGAFGFGMANLAGQIDAGYQDFSGGNLWNVDGSIFWAPTMGRLGVNVGYTGISVSGFTDLHITNYGAFGEFYAGDAFTLGAKAGATSISVSGFSGNGNGYYVGGIATGYATPNLAISGMVDYTDFDGTNLTNLTAQVEYMFSAMLPVSVYGGYTYSDFSGGAGNASQFFIGVKIYTGAGTTLIDNQRNGALGWIGNFGLRQGL